MTDILQSLITVACCQSTQDMAGELGRDLDAGAYVAVRADEQRAGRGRHGRVWEAAPRTALLLSVAMRPAAAFSPDQLAGLDLRCAHALQRELQPDRLFVKPPNDLVDGDGAKLAGVLVDARTIGDRVERIIVGVGMNVCASPTTRDHRRCTTLEAVRGQTRTDSWSSHDLDALATRVTRVILAVASHP